MQTLDLLSRSASHLPCFPLHWYLVKVNFPFLMGLGPSVVLHRSQVGTLMTALFDNSLNLYHGKNHPIIQVNGNDSPSLL